MRWHIPVAVLAGPAGAGNDGAAASMPAPIPAPLFQPFRRHDARRVLHRDRSCVGGNAAIAAGSGTGPASALLVWVIRSWGGYPDGFAFAVLLMNLAVPLIDRYTVPRIYGHARD